MANVPFGYTKTSCKDNICKDNIYKDSIIDVNTEEAKIVHKIFSLAADGLNCREIADILNTGGFLLEGNVQNGILLISGL